MKLMFHMPHSIIRTSLREQVSSEFVPLRVLTRSGPLSVVDGSIGAVAQASLMPELADIRVRRKRRVVTHWRPSDLEKTAEGFKSAPFVGKGAIAQLSDLA
jgi:hypothetical protein